MNIETAIRFAVKGHAVLFLGAGYSLGATNIKGTPFFSGKHLAKKIATAAGLPPDTPLALAAEIYRDQQGTDGLIALIKSAFTAAVPVPDAQKTVASLPWRRIYTTNYDDLFEKASEANGDSVFSVTIGDRLQNIPKSSRCCVHLNGYVGKLDRTSIDSELKLTDSSYLQNAILDSEWAVLLRQDFRLAKAIFFVGYSLYDYEIRKLLIDIPLLQEKAYFILGHNPNPVLLKQIQQYGTTLSQSTQQFAQKVVTEVDVMRTNPIEDAPETYVALHEFTVPSDSTKPKDADQWRLFLQGVAELPHLNFSVSADNPFVMRRSKTDDLLSQLGARTPLVAVLSELGNGKTIFLQTLQFELIARGFRVFWINETGDVAERELSQLAAQEGKKIFILEGYPDRLGLVETFSIHSHPDASLVVAARTSVHDIFVDALHERAHGKTIGEVRLDVLDDKELNWFSTLFTRFGMWGGRAGLSDSSKARFLANECQAQVHGILMKLLESPQIQQRLTTLFAPLTSEPKYQDILICIMVVAVLGEFLTVDVLADILGTDATSDPEFRKNPQIRQLVGFDSFRVNIRSPIVAQFFLTRLANKISTLNVLVRLATRGDKLRYTSHFFRSLFESLQRFSVVQRLFPLEGKLAVVTSYYEEIKALRGCTKNYHFWLQYAIACLTLGERERSKKYFDQAYAIAAERRDDAYQVDNHYSRYLLETAVDYPEAKEAMECFRQARDIINRQIKDERLHYPYRVAINYVRFINRFGSKLQPAWVDEIEQAAKSVAERIPELPAERKENRYVKECAKEMGYVLYKCAELKRRQAVS